MIAGRFETSRLDRARCLTTWSLLFGCVLVSAACHPANTASGPAETVDAQQVANLHAFARLYGVVRWFHPSDAAARVDWDHFAIAGVRSVIDAPDARSLRSRLRALFATIAPTVHFAGADRRFPDDAELHPTDGAKLDLVSWEHRGFGDSTLVSVFASKRRHRDRIVTEPGMPFAAFSQAIDATAFRGAKIRLRGKLRAAEHGHARLWLRVEQGSGVAFLDNMSDRPVSSHSWQAVELTGQVSGEATRIVFGTLLAGRGTAWYDDIELAAQRSDGVWQPIEVADPGFESDDLSSGWIPGIGKPPFTSAAGWSATLDHTGPASGNAALRVEAMTRTVQDELFTESPRPGETLDIDLGSGLWARIPISLYSRSGHTIGDVTDSVGDVVSHAESETGFDAAAGVADVIVTWNVLQHFWPYWDTVSVDWPSALDAALRAAVADRGVEDHLATLRRLEAVLPDGHAGATCVGEQRLARPPFAVDVLEGQVVITASSDKAVVAGDIVVSVDGRPALGEVQRAAALVSGSPQWRTFRALQRFGLGPAGSKLTLRLLRDKIERTAEVERGELRVSEFSHPAIERLEDGVYYVNMASASTAEVGAAIDRLASAPGVVFDVRDQPSADQSILSHLLTRPDDAKNWGSVAHVIRPDHTAAAIPTWESFGMGLPVLQPHISGRVAFLTGPGAISFGETLMAFVEYYHLGEIVGSPTPGTNGNAAEITLPSDCRTSFTGARVTKLDGSQLHLIGIRPSIPATRTIAGVIAGRDEVLEKALEYIRSGTSSAPRN